MKSLKQLSVSAIENGTVIDHIPAQSLFNVITILGLDHCTNQITFGTNLESKRLGHKAIVKIADKYFEDADINKISLVAPSAKLNIIKDYEVVEKKTVELPDELVGLVKCNNPKCITNNEPMPTRFDVMDKESGTVKCRYCERKINKEDIIIL